MSPFRYPRMMCNPIEKPSGGKKECCPYNSFSLAPWIAYVSHSIVSITFVASLARDLVLHPQQSGLVDMILRGENERKRGSGRWSVVLRQEFSVAVRTYYRWGKVTSQSFKCSAHVVLYVSTRHRVPMRPFIYEQAITETA